MFTDTNQCVNYLSTMDFCSGFSRTTLALFFFHTQWNIVTRLNQAFDTLKSRKGMQSQGSGSRFRFGIRSLLVVVLVSAIGLAIYVPLKHRHQTIHCGNASSRLNSAITTN